jgi:7,8-dihydropterin-6-yl-methyl-4-(beta-D-ribofuranosyl)aminobenzene 5'-phosphate synthase
MNLKILYDNEHKTGFRSGWGFSALIDDSLLFDTGEDAGALRDNMRSFGLDPSVIDTVVLSHTDWDHVGGMAILETCERVAVYLPAGSANRNEQAPVQFTNHVQVHEVIEPREIRTGVVVTARLGNTKPEISLRVDTERGPVLLTGCAHPGLDVIMAHAAQPGELYAVIGGFHDFDNLDALKDIPLILPCHCTRKKQEILDSYPDQARPGYAGLEIAIGGNA